MCGENRKILSYLEIISNFLLNFFDTKKIIHLRSRKDFRKVIWIEYFPARLDFSGDIFAWFQDEHFRDLIFCSNNNHISKLTNLQSRNICN
jgi:hypothetical protein